MFYIVNMITNIEMKRTFFCQQEFLPEVGKTISFGIFGEALEADLLKPNSAENLKISGQP